MQPLLSCQLRALEWASFRRVGEAPPTFRLDFLVTWQKLLLAVLLEQESVDNLECLRRCW